MTEIHSSQSTIGYLIVDHGSRRSESNEALEKLVGDFQERFGLAIVEPAHMELAEPTIEMAFDKCVTQGANFVRVCPFFLLPGKHWQHDIPALVAAAAEKHPGISFEITAPLGYHPAMLELLASVAGLSSNPG